MLICGSYRQWSLLKEMGVNNSSSNKNQEDRFKITIDNWQKALDEQRDTIFLTDDNIDSNIDSSMNKLHKIQNLLHILHDHMTKNNIVQHNTEDTRHIKHQKSSCIDKIYSNIPQKITNVTTHRNGFSDHSIISAHYNTKEQLYQPKFIKTRDSSKFNKNSLILAFKQNEILDKIFNHTNPNTIANILQIELNSIINTLAPPKITQYKTNYIPYIDDNIKRQMDMTQTLLNKAINTHGINDWIEYKNHRNLINKQIKHLKRNI